MTRFGGAGLDTTGFTFAHWTLSASKTSIAAGSWTKFYDTNEEDKLGEATDTQFTPSESGWYVISGTAQLTNNSGDKAAVRINNQDTGATDRIFGGRSFNEVQTFYHVKYLTAGEVYEFEAVNFDSTYEIGQKRSDLTVRRCLNQP